MLPRITTKIRNYNNQQHGEQTVQTFLIKSALTNIQLLKHTTA